MAECRPKNYPKLKDYKPSRFMLPTCHYDAAKADRAVTFIENLRHTKGKWAGKRFWWPCICFLPITSRLPKSMVLPLTASRHPSFLMLPIRWCR